MTAGHPWRSFSPSGSVLVYWCCCDRRQTQIYYLSTPEASLKWFVGRNPGWTRWVPSRGSGGEWFPFPFQLLVVAGIPQQEASPSTSKPAARPRGSPVLTLCFCHQAAFFWLPASCLPLIKTLWSYWGTWWSRIFPPQILNTYAKSLLSSTVTYSQILGIGPSHWGLGGCYSAYQSLC